MIIMQTTSTVENLSAKEAQDFLINCTDEMYQKSWPDVHIQKHPIKRGRPDHVGDVVYAFEYLGKFTIEAKMEVTKYIPEKLIEFRVSIGKTGSLVPVVFLFETKDCMEGVYLSNKFFIGWDGIGKIFDPIIELFFPKELRNAMEEHILTEWPLISASLKN